MTGEGSQTVLLIPQKHHSFEPVNRIMLGHRIFRKDGLAGQLKDSGREIKEKKAQLPTS